MSDADGSFEQDSAEELLRRALLDERSAVTVSLRVDGLPVSEALTILFCARRDLGTLQTYLTPGSKGAGARVATADLLRVPVDLDLAEAEDRRDAKRLYAQQAKTLCDALLGADIVLEVWREALARVAGHVVTDHSVEPAISLGMPRLLPTALVEPEAHIYVTPVCQARTLAEGQPPVGIACVQQDLTRIYPLAHDPEQCVDDFLEASAIHAHGLAEQIAHQEASVERFLELSDAA